MNICDLLLDDYDSEDREKKNLKATDDKLNSSRIYSLGLLEEEGEVKCVARYKLGFAFFKYAENRVDYITRCVYIFFLFEMKYSSLIPKGIL